MNNKDLIGKMVFVPRHDYSCESIQYLVGMYDERRLFLIDQDGNREIVVDSEIELREATQSEIAEDFMRHLGWNHPLSDLGAKEQEFIDGIAKKILDDCKREASKYHID